MVAAFDLLIARVVSLLRLDFFFHVDELLVGIVEFVLQESELLRGDNSHTRAVLHLPAALQGNKALIDVCRYIRMHVQVEFLDSNLVDQVINLALKLICEEDARLDGALAETSGTGLFDAYVHRRAHTLTRDLHQSELRQGCLNSRHVRFISILYCRTLAG